MKTIEINDKEFKYIKFDDVELLHIFEHENEKYYIKSITINDAKKELFASYVAKQADQELTAYKADMYLAKICYYENDTYTEQKIGMLRVENFTECNYRTNVLHPELFTDVEKSRGRKYICLYKNGEYLARKDI
jgi:hypothetical protein